MVELSLEQLNPLNRKTEILFETWPLLPFFLTMFAGIFITLYVQKAVSARSEVEPDVADGVGAIKEEKWDANLTKLVNFRLLNFRME